MFGDYIDRGSAGAVFSSPTDRNQVIKIFNLDARDDMVSHMNRLQFQFFEDLEAQQKQDIKTPGLPQINYTFTGKMTPEIMTQISESLKPSQQVDYSAIKSNFRYGDKYAIILMDRVSQIGPQEYEEPLGRRGLTPMLRHAYKMGYYVRDLWPENKGMSSAGDIIWFDPMVAPVNPVTDQDREALKILFEWDEDRQKQYQEAVRDKSYFDYEHKAGLFYAEGNSDITSVRYQDIDNPEWLTAVPRQMLLPQNTELGVLDDYGNTSNEIMLGPDYQDAIKKMVINNPNGFMMTWKGSDFIEPPSGEMDLDHTFWVYPLNKITDPKYEKWDAVVIDGNWVMSGGEKGTYDSYPLNDLFDATTGENPVYELRRFTKTMLGPLPKHSAINYATVLGNSYSSIYAFKRFDSEEESMRVYRRMSWEQYFDALETGYLMSTVERYQKDGFVPKGAWGMMNDVYASKVPEFESPLEHLGRDVNPTFEIELLPTDDFRDFGSGVVTIRSPIPIERVTPFNMNETVRRFDSEDDNYWLRGGCGEAAAMISKDLDRKNIPYHYEIGLAYIEDVFFGNHIVVVSEAGDQDHYGTGGAKKRWENMLLSELVDQELPASMVEDIITFQWHKVNPQEDWSVEIAGEYLPVSGPMITKDTLSMSAESYPTCYLCSKPAKIEVMTAIGMRNFCGNKCRGDYEGIDYGPDDYYISPKLEHDIELVSYDPGYIGDRYSGRSATLSVKCRNCDFATRDQSFFEHHLVKTLREWDKDIEEWWDTGEKCRHKEMQYLDYLENGEDAWGNVIAGHIVIGCPTCGFKDTLMNVDIPQGCDNRGRMEDYVRF